MSRSRVVASQPARASATSVLSLATAILSRLLVPACPGFARLHVRPGFASQCRTHVADGAPPVFLGGGRAPERRRADARLARAFPGLGSVTSRARCIRRIRYRPGGERSPSHLRVSTHSSTASCGQRGSTPGSGIGAAGNTRSSSILYRVDRATPS